MTTNNEEFKVGDKVWVNNWRNHGAMPEGTVKKLTATQIVVDRGHFEERYRRKDLVLVGEYYSPCLLRYDDEKALRHNARIEAKSRTFHAECKLEVAVKSLRGKGITADELNRLLEIAKEIEWMGQG